MIGLGKWQFKLKTMIFTGEVRVEIYDNGGQYGLRVLQPEMETPPVTVKSLTESGNIIKAVVNTSLLPHSDLTIVATIEGDSAEGYVKIPFLGKLPIHATRLND